MILNYDFGEYEISTEEVAQAIANTFKRDCKDKCLKTFREDNSLEKYITELIYDGVLDDEYIEDYYLEDIMAYWEDEASYDCKCAEEDMQERESILHDYILRGSL